MKNNTFKDIREGEFLSFTQYCRVINKTKDSVVIENQFGQELEICGIDLVESMNSSGQFTETRKVGKHEMVEALHNAKDTVFTACFTKKDGTERILIGHLKGIEAHLGRTEVYDLEIPITDVSKQVRLIDNRCLSWVVINNIKYTAQ